MFVSVKWKQSYSGRAGNGNTPAERCSAPGCSHRQLQANEQALSLLSASSQGYRLLASLSPLHGCRGNQPLTEPLGTLNSTPIPAVSLLRCCHGNCRDASVSTSPPLRVALGPKMGDGLRHPTTYSCFYGEMHSKFPSDQAINELWSTSCEMK